jgi:outer membrane immunogenic protein
MKKIILATVLAGLSSTAALAADLGARAPYSKAPAMVAAAASWAGFYLGGNVGYGWGNGNTDISFLPNPVAFGIANTSLDTRSRGVIGGAQIGYNWQAGAFVTGLEADIQGSGIKSSARSGPVFNTFAGAFVPGSFISSDQKLSWFGTVRGRLGVAVTPDILFYGTGGLAYGHVDDSAQTFESITAQFPASISTTRVGWTAGGGAEWMFGRQWSAKIEYLYLDLGTVSAVSNNPLTLAAQANYTWKNQDHIVRAGVNYHF